MENNEPAFPTNLLNDSNGMTMRDYFAAKSLHGLIPIIGIPNDGPDELWDLDTAKRAYSIADAMMEARK